MTNMTFQQILIKVWKGEYPKEFKYLLFWAEENVGEDLLDLYVLYYEALDWDEIEDICKETTPEQHFPGAGRNWLSYSWSMNENIPKEVFFEMYKKLDFSDFIGVSEIFETSENDIKWNERLKFEDVYPAYIQMTKSEQRSIFSAFIDNQISDEEE